VREWVVTKTIASPARACHSTVTVKNRIVLASLSVSACAIAIATGLVVGCSSGSSTNPSPGPGDSGSGQDTSTGGDTGSPADTGSPEDVVHAGDGPHDGGAPDALYGCAAQGSFGWPCTAATTGPDPTNCTDPAYPDCFVGGQGAWCTKTCTAATDCTSGTEDAGCVPTSCNLKGYCK
jgi:hypothetical protein